MFKIKKNKKIKIFVSVILSFIIFFSFSIIYAKYVLQNEFDIANINIDGTKPKIEFVNITNTNSEYPNYASKKHNIIVRIKISDKNIKDIFLDKEHVKVKIAEKIVEKPNIKFTKIQDLVNCKIYDIELKDLPDRLEAGTPNIEGVIGLNASIEYINNVGLDKINKYEHELRDYLIKKLSELDFIELYNRDNYSTSVAFNIKGVFSQDTALYLDKYHICVRAGNHCAKILNNVFNINNTCRITLSFYNTYEEIDLLINVLKNSSNIWKEIL